METNHQDRLRGWTRERIEAHVRVITQATTAKQCRECAICCEAERLGLWKVR